MTLFKRPVLLYFGLLLLLLLAFGLRLYQLDGQSFWSDEGLSLYRAQQPFSEVWRNIITVDGIDTEDNNPPLYFLLLHIWQQGVGDSVFVLRYLGVLLALPTVPLIYLLGKTALSATSGFLAALLLAISPFHVWQSQVLRNYGLLLTLNLLCVYALFRLTAGHQTEARRWPWLLLYLSSGLAGIYTHYFGFFIFAYTILAFIGMSWQRWGIDGLLRRRKLWLGFLVGGLLLLPIIPIALERFAAGQQIDFYWIPVPQVAYYAASAFTVGMSGSLTHPAWRVWPLVVVAALGFIWLWRRRPTAAWLLLGYQLIPLALLLSLSLFNPLYNGTRHLLIGLPPFLLLLAVGVTGIKGKYGFSVLALFFVLGSQTAHLIAQFHAPELVRDDVRGAALYLNQVATADDIIILHDTILQFTFNYYYEGAAPLITIPMWAEQDRDQVQARLASLAPETDRLWFLTEPMPRTGFDRTYLSEWAAANWVPIYEQRYPAMWLPVNLVGYLSEPDKQDLPPTATAVSAQWENGFELHGYKVPATAGPHQDWWVSFYLSMPPDQVVTDHHLSLRLRDEQGQVWAQIDQGFDARRTAVSDPDLIQRHDFPLRLPVGLSPGRYQLELHLTNWQTGRTIPLLDGGTTVSLNDVSVLPSRCRQPAAGPAQTVAQNHRLHPDLSLQGYTGLNETYRPGHALALSLFWCAERTPGQDMSLRLQLVNSADEVIATSEQPLGRTNFPSGQWTAGQLVMDRARLTVPGTATAEPHTLRLSLITEGGETAVPPLYRWLGRAETTLAQINVVPWPFVGEFPPIATSYEAEWGRPTLLSLQGYDLTPVEPGAVLPLTLYWRGQSDAIEHNYLVFIHIVDKTGAIVAQGDGPPVNGFRPTSSWRSGEALVDERAIWLPPELAVAEYDIYLGLYRPDTGERLPVFQEGIMQPDGRLWLGRFIAGEQE